jgi:hypothetical protein
LAIKLLTHSIDPVKPIISEERIPMLNKIWKTLFSGLLAICLVMGLSMQDSAIARNTIFTKSFVNYLVVPDYLAQKLTIQSLQKILSSTGKPVTISVLTPNCNPNSTAYKNSKLYVACNKDKGNGDYIGVYNFAQLTKLNAIPTSIPFSKIIRSPEFDSIIAIAFDPENNLWISSYNNNQIIRIPQTGLSTASPAPDKKIVNSPDQPAGITFDPLNSSLWIAGQYAGGIVLNIPKSELDKPGTLVGSIATINATPTYCISNSAPGCTQQPGLFDNPEGIAIFNNDIWVSNNGGDHPAASLVRLRPTQGTADQFGQGIGLPFSCPGGLKAMSGELWVNDQSAPLRNTTCGATDSASDVGKIFAYIAADLKTPASINLNPSEIVNITSRPGFGGIDVFSHTDPD